MTRSTDKQIARAERLAKQVFNLIGDVYAASDQLYACCSEIARGLTETKVATDQAKRQKRLLNGKGRKEKMK